MNKRMHRLALAGLVVGLAILALAPAWGWVALTDEGDGDSPPTEPSAPPSLDAAVTIFSEGFESGFGNGVNGWTVSGGWDDVDWAFGGEGTVRGSGKAYCAATNHRGDHTNPVYPSDMSAVMRRKVDMPFYRDATVSFYWKMPSLDTRRDGGAFYVDGSLVAGFGSVQAGWTAYTASLSAFGSVATLEWRFGSDVMEEREGWYIDALTVSGVQTGQYRVCVTNNDDDDQEVYYKTDLQTAYNYPIPAPAGSTTCWKYIMTDAGDRTVYIQWTDPDTGEVSTLSQGLTVPWKGQATGSFTVPRNPLYNVRVQNYDDDSLLVEYKLESETSYHSFRVPNDSALTSASWPAPSGMGGVIIRWTDPDTGQQMTQNTGYVYLQPGQTTTFNVTILSNPYYNVRVQNDDDDMLTVQFKLESETSYHSFVVAAGSTSTSNVWPAPSGTGRVTIRWTDPDTGQANSQTSGAMDIRLGQTTTFPFTIRPNPLYNVRVQNNYEVDVLVEYRLDSETSYHSMTVPGRGAVTSPSWPGSAGVHSAQTYFTNPDSGAKLSVLTLPNWAELSFGQTAAFSSTIVPYPRWNVMITNGDDDDLEVQYRLNPEVPEDTYHSMTIPAGSTVTSPIWANYCCEGQTTIRWTDPDRGTESSMTSPMLDLTWGLTTTYSFTIPRYSLHTIAVSGIPAEGGTPTGGGTYEYGATATLHANPARIYAINWWTEGGVIVVDNWDDWSFTVTRDRTLVAHYEQTTGPTLALSPEATAAAAGSIFTLDVMVHTFGEPVKAADAYINFDPAKLQVVDAAGVPTTTITADTAAFPTILTNVADNALGRIDFRSVAPGDPPFGATGVNRIAQITFRALTVTTGTPVVFSLDSPRRSDLSYAGSSILDTTIDASVVISPAAAATLIGTVGLEGRPARPAPAWSVPLRIVLSGTTPVAYDVTTDQNGMFTVSDVPPGTYNITVKSSHTLSTIKSGVTIMAGTNSVDFGTLLEGDANNDDSVTTIDLSILIRSFGKTVGDPGYDERADFNEDSYITSLDFSLLRKNYGQYGPKPALGAEAP
jgi:hypothetical protein